MYFIVFYYQSIIHLINQIYIQPNQSSDNIIINQP